MAYLQKRKLTFITIGLIFLLSGIEYAVILPTIWRYLQILQAPPYFLGLTLSAFSLSGLLSGPVFGRWSDGAAGAAATKPVLLLANLFQIVGSFLYFVGYSKWLLVGSRLVAGVGAGAGSSVFAFLTRITRPEERAGVFAAVMACRQAGLLVGGAGAQPLSAALRLQTGSLCGGPLHIARDLHVPVVVAAPVGHPGHALGAGSPGRHGGDGPPRRGAQSRGRGGPVADGLGRNPGSDLGPVLLRRRVPEGGGDCSPHGSVCHPLQSDGAGDGGDAADAALPGHGRVGQQRHVRPLRGRGHPGLPPGAPAQRQDGRPRRAGRRPAGLLRGLRLVPALPLRPPRQLRVEAVGLGRRHFPAIVGAPLRGRVSGVALLQSHGGLHARIQPRNKTIGGRPGHHLGSSVGRRPDQPFVRHDGHDAGAPLDARRDDGVVVRPLDTAARHGRGGPLISQNAGPRWRALKHAEHPTTVFSARGRCCYHADDALEHKGDQDIVVYYCQVLN
ncbi:uncharacterized protein LOC144085585 isoform X1 [Stigmatopora argus]